MARLSVLILMLVLESCTSIPPHADEPAGVGKQAHLTPASDSYRDLLHLPRPKGRITVAVYGIRDQTGQYKPAPDSSFSTAVTQGATSILVKALNDSQWFVPVERENLQDVLTERRVVRAAEPAPAASTTPPNLPALLPASILIEGAIVGYDSNIKTGGAGASYLGIGANAQYRTDQVTISLRAIDIRSGRILHSVSTTKAIYSTQVDLNVYRFVRYQHLLQMEVGYARDEPAQLCVADAIEAAVVNLIVQGVQANTWALDAPSDLDSPVFRRYIEEQRTVMNDYPGAHAKTGGS
ncbi:MAG TPA: CsgG/HfaB family protein [Dyella sp.]|uniref:CsgG/HfaB family protein n=1 Tax=Dyella sp. TaxID=1869338 RepID=UPI002D7768E7|nr:CsgG/HfaB family protein [Dyella sp.]HET6555205.1 CsgG/HfaB family protein [Dyella sp.]